MILALAWRVAPEGIWRSGAGDYRRFCSGASIFLSRLLGLPARPGVCQVHDARGFAVADDSGADIAARRMAGPGAYTSAESSTPRAVGNLG
jgi:hypothetical protein